MQRFILLCHVLYAWLLVCTEGLDRLGRVKRQTPSCNAILRPSFFQIIMWNLRSGVASTSTVAAWQRMSSTAARATAIQVQISYHVLEHLMARSFLPWVPQHELLEPFKGRCPPGDK